LAARVTTRVIHLSIALNTTKKVPFLIVLPAAGIGLTEAVAVLIVPVAVFVNATLRVATRIIYTTTVIDATEQVAMRVVKLLIGIRSWEADQYHACKSDERFHDNSYYSIAAEKGATAPAKR